MVARIDNGLLHLLQANHAGIEGDIGFFRSQVHAHVHYAVQLLEGDFKSSHAHGTDHASYFKHDLLVDHIVARVPYRLFQIGKVQLLRIVFD